ncbi:hypothetical protein KEM52_006403 [Ascosphaera acerosa]|nr:hypothetical protein KEM52_006403 [Ascosphaera acerosa]
MSTITIPNSVAGLPPYWGEATSHMNFCENDYEFSSYFGEFINTITSFAYVFFGAYPLFRQWRAGSRSQWTHSLSYIALIVVGIGSTLFHLTMKYELQLGKGSSFVRTELARYISVDDLSMLLGAATMFHHVLTLDQGWRKQVNVFLGIVVLLALSVWAHVYTGDSALHQVVFGSMVFTVGYKLVKLNKLFISDENLQRKLLKLMFFTIIELSAAYTAWVLDTLVCTRLRSVRAAVGLPWAWLFELHGWWHILTAFGVYIAMVEGEYLYAVHRGMRVDPEISYLRILQGPDPQHAKKE